jgi:hypothetical protein
MYTKNEMYDPELDTWVKKSGLQTIRHTYFLGATGNKIYAIAGSYPEGNNPIILTSVEEYDPEIDTVAEPITPVEEYYDINSQPFMLHQNYPNPVQTSTTIRYMLNENVHVRLAVFDILGNEVSVLVNERQSVGDYEIHYNAEGMENGIYFYTLNFQSSADYEFAETKKFVLYK